MQKLIKTLLYRANCFKVCCGDLRYEWALVSLKNFKLQNIDRKLSLSVSKEEGSLPFWRVGWPARVVKIEDDVLFSEILS